MRVEERDAGLTSRESEISGLDVGVAHLGRAVALREFDGLSAKGRHDLGGFLRGAGLAGFELRDFSQGSGKGGFGGLEGFGKRSNGSVLDGGFDAEAVQFGRSADSHLLHGGAEVVAFGSEAGQRGGGRDELLFDGHLRPAEIGNLRFRSDRRFDGGHFFVFLFDDFRDVFGSHDGDAQGGHGVAGVGAVVDEEVNRASGIELGLNDASLEGRGLGVGVVHDQGVVLKADAVELGHGLLAVGLGAVGQDDDFLAILVDVVDDALDGLAVLQDSVVDVSEDAGHVRKRLRLC